MQELNLRFGLKGHSSTIKLIENGSEGLEPLTFYMQNRRSTNWTTLQTTLTGIEL